MKARVIGGLLVLGVVGSFCVDEDKREMSREKPAERRKGFHCLSGWDGSHPEFVRLVKQQMNDPDSFEHDETRVTEINDQGRHEIIMNFRGRNAFGGTVRAIALGSYSPSCSPRLDLVR